jgi:hypothetical protein
VGTPDVANLMKTKATVWYAPYGEVLPDETTVAAGADWGGNWARIGYTKAPLVIAYESEEFDLTVEEHLAAVARRKISHSARAETVLAEMTAAYLKLAEGGVGVVETTAAGAAQVAYEEALIEDSAFLKPYIVGFEGNHYTDLDDALPFRLFFLRATLRFNGNLEFSQKSSEYSGIPLIISALADTALEASPGALVRWQRVTAPATG